jgi:hypothetical protein
MSDLQKFNDTLQELVLKNINQFLDEEGYRKERVAQKMGKSTSAFYAHLQGKHPKTIFQFATELAILLGFKQTFFLDEDFKLPKTFEETDRVAFSLGSLSKCGEKGLAEISKLCDLIEVYF